MSDLEADLVFAHRLADAAEPIALRHFTAVNTAWRTKHDGSPVSEADEQIERALRAEVRRHRPGDALLGEELGAAGHGRRRWVIDAVDGTASFLAGEPEWSTLIALEEKGTAQLGVVAAPALQRRCGPLEETAPGHDPPPTTVPSPSPSPAQANCATPPSASGPRHPG